MNPTTAATVRPKEFHFPLAVEWLGGRRVAVLVEGKDAVEVMPPPVFRGTDPSAWSPEISSSRPRRRASP